MLHWWNYVHFRQLQCLAWTLSASLQSEALVECSQPCSTIQTSRYVNVCVASPLWMLGHFPAFSFRLFYFFLEEVRMCLRGTGVLNKLKELKKPFCSFGLEIVNSHDDVCVPQIFPFFFFFLSWVLNGPFPPLPLQIEWQHSREVDPVNYFFPFTCSFSYTGSYSVQMTSHRCMEPDL